MTIKSVQLKSLSLPIYLEMALVLHNIKEIILQWISYTEYDTGQSVNYKLRRSYTNFPLTGPDIRVITVATQEEDNEDEEGEEDMQEDHHALLVKAWESKVFPVIRRRFRNEAERRSGLEQIKGALQLGE